MTKTERDQFNKEINRKIKAFELTRDECTDSVVGRFSCLTAKCAYIYFGRSYAVKMARGTFDLRLQLLKDKCLCQMIITLRKAIGGITTSHKQREDQR